MLKPTHPPPQVPPPHPFPPARGVPRVVFRGAMRYGLGLGPDRWASIPGTPVGMEEELETMRPFLPPSPPSTRHVAHRRFHFFSNPPPFFRRLVAVDPSDVPKDGDAAAGT